jgi:hypothetical protein
MRIRPKRHTAGGNSSTAFKIRFPPIPFRRQRQRRTRARVLQQGVSVTRLLFGKALRIELKEH